MKSRGLRCHMNRFSHIVVNVSDLEASRALYEATSPLRAVARIQAPHQKLDVLGFEEGSFEGYVLRDPIDGDPCEIYLVQWASPTPVGNPYPRFFNLGYYRISFKSTDVPKRYNDALEHNGRPFTAPLEPRPGHTVGRPVFGYRDPDGTVLEYVTLPGPERLYHMNLNCRNVLQSRRFFEENLGLTCYLRAVSDKPEINSFDPDSGLSEYDAALFKVGGGSPAVEQPMFTLDVVEWTMPGPSGTPYQTQNNLGIARIVLEVDDVDACYEEASADAEILISSGPATIDYGPEVGNRKSMMIKTAEGAAIELVQQPDYPGAG